MLLSLPPSFGHPIRLTGQSKLRLIVHNLRPEPRNAHDIAGREFVTVRSQNTAFQFPAVPCRIDDSEIAGRCQLHKLYRSIRRFLAAFPSAGRRYVHLADVGNAFGADVLQCRMLMSRAKCSHVEPPGSFSASIARLSDTSSAYNVYSAQSLTRTKRLVYSPFQDSRRNSLQRAFCKNGEAVTSPHARTSPPSGRRSPKGCAGLFYFTPPPNHW